MPLLIFVVTGICIHSGKRNSNFHINFNELTVNISRASKVGSVFKDLRSLRACESVDLQLHLTSTSALNEG